jgi:succinate-semialdehyde dehydrogenase / glutarate-semialdehyde dehydrogenase
MGGRWGTTPFGGVKESGLGRGGGRVGIAEFLEYKLITMPMRR